MTPPFPLLPASLWEHVPVFREAYLCVRLDEEGAEALRTLGRRLYLGSLAIGWEPRGAESEPLQAALHGAARDARALEGFLRALGAGSDLPPPAAARARVAHRVADVLGRLAGDLEGAIR